MTDEARIPDERVERIFQGIGAKLRADFNEISSTIQHAGGQGTVREAEVLEGYLSTYLPGTVHAVHSGEIIDTRGHVSRQEDVLVIDPTTPPLVDKTNYRVVPVECVHGVIEVKSRLTTTQLDGAHTNITEAKKLQKQAFKPQSGPILRETHLFGRAWNHFPTYGTIFAYDAIDLRTLRKRLDDLNQDQPLHQRVDSVWVLNQGMIVNWSDDQNQIFPEPRPDTRLRAVKSQNPLLLMTVHLQQVFEGAWMPYFRLTDYLKGSRYGEFLEP